MKQKAGFWKTDWFLGVVVLLAVFAVQRSTTLIESLERKAYDLASSLSSKAPSDKIAIIAIDNESIANIGRWPWQRDIHAKMTDILTSAKPKVIAETIFFSEAQRDPGLVYIEKLGALYNKQFGPDTGQTSPGDMAQFGGILKEAQDTLDTDRQLAESFKHAGNVVLPMSFALGEPRGRPDKALPDFVSANALSDKDTGGVAEQAIDASPPIEVLGKTASAIGHLTLSPDFDGGIRTEPLVVGFFDQTFPSLSLMVAAKSLNLGPQDIRVNWGESVNLGRLHIGTDGSGAMYPHFYPRKGDKSQFQVDSFYDVLTGKIAPGKYADKIVLIGATATGVGTSFPTPTSPAMAPVELLANSISSILSEQFYVVPTWAAMVDLLISTLIAVYLIVLLPRLKAGMGAALTGLLLVALLGAHFALMLGPGLWLQLMYPATLLLVGHLALTTKRFLVTEAGKEKSDLESAESNRMLGLAFQGQGQLDMAFDKFRKCPLDDAVMENLYSLALDFERKRQFNKAQAVYEYMHRHDPKFRDLAQKLARAKTMSETIILGGGGGRTNASLMTGDAVEKPMLGRYQVEKELGKGAMGVVYMGRDPKIGRVVAIKTMALAQEFEPDELQEVKERFFREAETAGRLNHPYIVTIFDAGEEHDLAYIAMEFLKGRDLVPYTKVDGLLPLERVVSIGARVAEALDYAQKQHVVHRDIKPANIMYELESDTVKVTDFGIARITDSSKTKTGMVLGTPSYMSPEQLSGLKIDGRSDLFSLAVSLYQMCCGRLPFVADSMAQLMYKIANEEAPDIRTLNSAVPDALAEVIKKGMRKDMGQRYQTGEEFAADLRTIYGPARAAPAAHAAPAPRPAAPRPQPVSHPQPTAAFDTTQVLVQENYDRTVPNVTAALAAEAARPPVAPKADTVFFPKPPAKPDVDLEL